jgi:hypothetical protein
VSQENVEMVRQLYPEPGLLTDARLTANAEFNCADALKALSLSRPHDRRGDSRRNERGR